MSASLNRVGKMTQIIGLMRRFADAAVQLVYPAACPSCRESLPGQLRDSPNVSALCERCAPTILHVEGPLCSLCGHPRRRQLGRVHRGVDLKCANCVADPPAFERARSLYEYGGAIAQAIQYIKYSRSMWPISCFARPFADWLVAELDSFEESPMLTTVPMHRRHLAERGFHLTECLLRRCAAYGSIPAPARLLRKTRHTHRQAGLSRAERAENVRDAFMVRRGAPLRGRAVVVIDDVITTGATTHEAARALLHAGARSVRVLTLARAVRHNT